jgi:hypothetical protein
MCRASQLMNKVEHVILTVDIASFTVAVIGVFFLVGDHCICAREMLEAVLVGAFDLHLVQKGMITRKEDNN